MRVRENFDLVTSIVNHGLVLVRSYLCAEIDRITDISPENKQDWLIDEEAAEVVREIFDLYVHHAMGTKQIAQRLMAEKRVRITYYQKLRQGIELTDEKIYSWCSATVASILKRQEYVIPIREF